MKIDHYHNLGLYMMTFAYILILLINPLFQEDTLRNLQLAEWEINKYVNFWNHTFIVTSIVLFLIWIHELFICKRGFHRK